jgi:hypothetical protein
MERRPSWLGRVTLSEPRSRPAARTCAGLDSAGAYRAIMICVIIRNLHSDGRDTEAHAIGQHPMHDDGDFARQRHLGLLHPAPPASFIAQLFNAVQPLSGLVSMMLAAS